jgi:MFS family permease
MSISIALRRQRQRESPGDSLVRARPAETDLDLFRSRTVVITVATGFAFMVGYYGLPFVFSLYFQELCGLSALGTGVMFLPMMLIGAALTPFSAHAAEPLGRKTLITFGLFLMTVGLIVPASCRHRHRYGCCLH